MSVPARLLELERERSSMPPVRALADQVFSRAAGAPLIGGNEVRLLKDAAENYPAWLDAIRASRKHVHFESYIIHEDSAGAVFSDALLAAAALFPGTIAMAPRRPRINSAVG